MKKWIVPFTMLVFGVVIGIGLSESKKKPTKKYPIEVQSYWSTDGYSSYPSMECDSVKGDTLWKDGSKKVNRNIINISFK